MMLFLKQQVSQSGLANNKQKGNHRSFRWTISYTYNKKRSARKTKSNIDDFYLCVIRRNIHEFNFKNKSLPILKGLLADLKEKTNFMSCKMTE